jgi:hypothetical protein
MNWSHCSRVALLAALLVVLVAAPVAAVSVSADDAPSDAEVESKVDVTFTISDLYTDYDSWSLQGQSDLSQVSWTVVTYDQTGAKITQQTYNNQTFAHQIAASNDVNRVEVRLEATVPGVSNWSYASPQTFRLAAFTQAQEGGTSTRLQSYDVQPYTADSRAARTAIDDAQEAIDDADEAGGDVSDAEADLEDAVEFYNNGNFEQATKNANEAAEKAEGAASSAAQSDLLVKAAIGVVLLLLVGGGIYWFLQQRTTHDKLG